MRGPARRPSRHAACVLARSSTAATCARCSATLYFVVPAIGLVLGVFAGVYTNGPRGPAGTRPDARSHRRRRVRRVRGARGARGVRVRHAGHGAPLGCGHVHRAAGGADAGLHPRWPASASACALVRRRADPEAAAAASAAPSADRGRAVVQRVLDHAFVAILGTFIIWLAAWQMPVLAGNRPQELFVTIQDHLTAGQGRRLRRDPRPRRRSGDGRRDHFRGALRAVDADGPRPQTATRRLGVLLAISGAFVFAVLWEFLGFGWMTWVVASPCSS